MLQRPRFRQALARLEHLLRAAQPASPTRRPPEPAVIAAAGERVPLTVPVQPAPPGTVVPDALAVAPPAASTAPVPAPAPAAPHTAHHQGMVMARAHRWNWAQRELERAAREEPHGPAAADLASVRTVRRQLRLLDKWPRDAQAYVDLGRAYMELELGEAAEQAYQRAITLAPEQPTAYFFLALEYLYRGATAEAARAYAQAQALVTDLPPFAELLAEWTTLPEEAHRLASG